MEIIETLDIPCALEFIPSTQEPAQATIAPEPAQATIAPDIKPKKKYVKDWKKYNKTFYEKNKDNKKTCPDCGHQYMYSVYSQHKKLKKHIGANAAALPPLPPVPVPVVPSGQPSLK